MTEMPAIISDEKSTLRSKAKDQLTLVFRDQDDIYKRQIVLTQKIEDLPCFVNAKVVLTYYPSGFEFDLNSLLITNPDKHWVLPRAIGDSRLLLFEAGDLFNLKESKYGIKVPPASNTLFKPFEIDLVIVPALAYDSQKYRLGRGGGYYDRLLAALSPKTKTIGVIPKELYWDSLVHEAHDQAVSMVLAI